MEIIQICLVENCKNKNEMRKREKEKHISIYCDYISAHPAAEGKVLEMGMCNCESWLLGWFSLAGHVLWNHVGRFMAAILVWGMKLIEILIDFHPG